MKALLILLLLLFAANFLTAQPSVRIDMQKTQAPISPYIYGQFIEHLGKCIYGGIWAEMLQDRKFYYPITDDYNPWGSDKDEYWNAGEFQFIAASPWKVIGPVGTVRMDSTTPFVGAQSPVVRVPGDGSEAGITQPLLAVIKDKSYTGRIILAGKAVAAPIEIRLVDDAKVIAVEKINSLSKDFKSYPLTFKANKSSDKAAVEIVSRGSGEFKIGALSLMPADNINGWRRDVVALLKELNAPIYRWPGGNFVSGYNWRDGIGPRDKRPPRKNPAWKGVEHNDVGIHEYMDLMDMLNAEAYIAVNTGLGSVDEVAEEVEYINGSADTPLGSLRAKNGHAAPYGVKWWAVGNEMYGTWQLGHIPLEEYVQKHNRVAEAMWKVDPTIKLVGVGAVGKWSEAMLRQCSDYMSLISEHIYCKEKGNTIDHTKQLADEIRKKAQAHRRYRRDIPGLAARDIRIAMDEWNYWYGDYIYGELGVRYHLKDALGVARGLHEYFRNSDIYFMANYAQTVNVIGCIKTSRTDACFATTGLPLKLYRREFGAVPVALSGETGDLDIIAAKTKNGDALTIAVVNPTTQSRQVAVTVSGGVLNRKGAKWLISGDDPQAYNEPGKTPNVAIIESTADLAGSQIAAPALSIALYRFEIK